VRILLVTSTIPSGGHRTAGAIAIVSHEAACALRDAGHEVVVQTIFAPGRTESLSPAERADLELLRPEGLRTEEPLRPPHGLLADPRRAALRQALAPTASAFYPSLELAPDLRRRVDELGVDLVLELWSPEALGACSQVEAPIFNYQGNPDHLPEEARLKHPGLFELGTDTARQRTFLALRRRAVRNWRSEHLDLMRRCCWTGNNSALDAEWYTTCGHPRSYYLQNMWPAAPDGWQRSRAQGPIEPGTVIGSIGNLRSTGNTFGLLFLGREIAPALERELGDAFSIHVFGNGVPRPLVAAALDQPRVRLRGWIDDIDGEIAAAGVFLLANNNCPDFRVGHTRVLHAWSLGACLVAHEGIALAMPEIVHGENALLGGSADELAGHVAAALRDKDLRRRLGDAGQATFEQWFRPAFVVDRALAIVAG
jgi:glycosyltransferase involved in cell wall biosynthesis